MLKKEKVEVFVCTCDHGMCGYVWKTFTIPKRCARCKKINWNKEVQKVEPTVPQIEIVAEKIQVTPKAARSIMDQILNYKPIHSPACTCLMCKPPKEK